MRRFRSRFVALTGMLGVAAWIVAGNVTAASAGSGGSVKPNAVNMLDCNGFSAAYRPLKANMGALCADPITIRGGEAYRASDNGHYIGHDEPSVKFISSAPGSAKHMTYVMRLAVDPKGKPTTSPTGTTRSKYEELSIAPWFGLPICDPKSYPQNSCTPGSDLNRSNINDPTAAGSAFFELQFYPPGFGPFQDAYSCDATRYCAALTIDSLSCTFNFVSCNGNCFEPINFAYLQTNGVPTGPPSPQLANGQSLGPNRHTLMMNPGDTLEVTIADTTQGLLTRIVDRTTHQSGYMVASAANGFMNTDINDCTGTPFSFHPEFNRALQQNQVPWAALEGGVLMQQELGHFEPCASVTNPFPTSITYSDGSTFTDPHTYQTCKGGFEASGTGEACDLSTFTCPTATTEGGGPCPGDSPRSGALCEYSDALCVPAGPRQVSYNGHTEIVRWPIAACEQNIFQNGDLDFDGSSYIPDWPDGSRNHPTSFTYLGPFDARGAPYPQVQFETDLGGSEALCQTDSGDGCTVPPLNAAFYPFWTIGQSGEQGDNAKASVNGNGQHANCLWNFGNVIPGVTTQDFGKDAQYGSPDTARYGGTFASAVMSNPQFSGACAQD